MYVLLTLPLFNAKMQSLMNCIRVTGMLQKINHVVVVCMNCSAPFTSCSLLPSGCVETWCFPNEPTPRWPQIRHSLSHVAHHHAACFILIYFVLYFAIRNLRFCIKSVSPIVPIVLLFLWVLDQMAFIYVMIYLM